MNETTPSFPHLQNAPIVEAIIDFRVHLPAAFDLARFKALHPHLQSEYPEVRDRKLTEYKYENTAGKQSSLSVEEHGTHGFWFRSADNLNIAQFRRDGFTFNRLKPYTSWEQVFQEATRLWKLYAHTCQPTEISRVAVRYINRLMLPGPPLEFSEYLAAPPAVPGGQTSSLAAIHPDLAATPPFVSGFVSRVVINDPMAGVTTAVVQALEPSTDGRYVPLILDIDVSQQNVSNLSQDEVLSRFEELRNAKNRAFFGSITNRALEMLK